jgi:uncharacterized damage-inducible protein DinB
MLTEYVYPRNYLFTALEAGPDLLTRAIQGLTPQEADARPDPDRFTIREIMAHMAEWDAIFLARMTRMRDEDQPVLENYDEGQIAIDHHYERTDPVEQAALLRERRARTVEFLRSLTLEQWQRTGDRPEIGIITIEAIATLMTLHDTYHLRQVAEWRSR